MYKRHFDSMILLILQLCFEIQDNCSTSIWLCSCSPVSLYFNMKCSRYTLLHIVVHDYIYLHHLI